MKKKKAIFKSCLFIFRDKKYEEIYKQSITATYAANFYKLMGIFAISFIIGYAIMYFCKYILGSDVNVNPIGWIADILTALLFFSWGWIISRWPKFRTLVGIISLLYFSVVKFELEIMEFDILNAFVWYMIYQIWVVGIALEVFISPYVSVLCYFLSCLYITLRILYGYIYGGDETSTCFRQGLLVVYPIYSFIIFALYCCLLYTVVKSKKKSFLLAFKTMEAFQTTMELFPTGVVITNESGQEILYHNSAALTILHLQNISTPELLKSRLKTCKEVLGAYYMPYEQMGDLCENQDSSWGPSSHRPIEHIKDDEEGIDQFDPRGVVEVKSQKIYFQGHSEAILYILTNISHVKELEEQKAQKKHRNMFVSTVTHELRTPLNCIHGNLQCLNYIATEESLPYLKISLNSCELMTSLINDILDMAKVEAGTLKINEEICDIRQIIEFIRDVMGSQIKQKNLEIDINISEECPKLIKSDEKRIKQILLNYISNGIKFTKSGGITISIVNMNISEELTDFPREYIKFSVSDTGVGISKSDIEYLFKPFQILEGTREMNKSGSGLGLNICKNLAQAMGGDVGVKSILGLGSTFSFWLPAIYVSSHIHDEGRMQSFLNIPSPTQSRRISMISSHSDHHFTGLNRQLNIDIMTEYSSEYFEQELMQERHADTRRTLPSYKQHEPSFASKNRFKALATEENIPEPFEERKEEIMNVERNRESDILIVDDDAFNLLTLKNMIKLVNPKASLETANGGTEALNLVQNGAKYKIIFMDWYMPIISGYQTALEINNLLEMKIIQHKPIIIVLSGCSAAAISEQCASIGIQYIYEKPINLMVVKELLAYFEITQKLNANVSIVQQSIVQF